MLTTYKRNPSNVSNALQEPPKQTSSAFVISLPGRSGRLDALDERARLNSGAQPGLLRRCTFMCVLFYFAAYRASFAYRNTHIQRYTHRASEHDALETSRRRREMNAHPSLTPSLRCLAAFSSCVSAANLPSSSSCQSAYLHLATRLAACMVRRAPTPNRVDASSAEPRLPVLLGPLFSM